ncbi:hypothetical protein WJM97_22495 [Okeanomitos corallinicola TIOX110]|uniref:Uncharacterized protein n=1 Tax=Okeanomitos corallinicola TIOX110 TaxID=3133117 RepID=A0ABZ2URT3_9CYAN
MKLTVENNNQKLRIYLELSSEEVTLYKRCLIGFFSVSLPLLFSYTSLIRVINPIQTKPLPPQNETTTGVKEMLD